MIISLRKKEREMWEGRRKGERERRKREEGWKGELVWRDESIGICGRVLGRRSYSFVLGFGHAGGQFSYGDKKRDGGMERGVQVE